MCDLQNPDFGDPEQVTSIRLFMMHRVVNSALRDRKRSPETLEPMGYFWKLLTMGLRNMPERTTALYYTILYHGGTVY
jgi:hypothetical protein